MGTALLVGGLIALVGAMMSGCTARTVSNNNENTDEPNNPLESEENSKIEDKEYTVEGSQDASWDAETETDEDANIRIEKERQELIQKFLESVKKSFSKLTYEDWKNGDYEKLKLQVGDDQLEVRKNIISRLREIDAILDGKDYPVSRSQMEILGMLRTPTRQGASISLDGCGEEFMSFEQVHNDYGSGWQDYDFDLMNDTFIEYNITDPRSLRLFLIAASGESDFGADTYQDDYVNSEGWPQDWTGADYLQVSSKWNYPDIADEMKRKGDFDSSPEDYDTIHNDPKEGPKLLSEKYKWKGSAAYWTHTAKLDQIAKDGGTIYEITNTMFYPYDWVEEPGKNYRIKKILSYLSEGLI